MNSDILRFLRYLSFRADCLREQQEYPLTVDLEKAQRHSDELSAVISEKTEALAKVMPKVPSKTQNRPKNLYKKDGSFSEHGKKWFGILKELKLPENTEGPVVVEWQDGNPGSTLQVKEWLYSLGWEPCTFKYERNKITGDEKKIPQVRYVAQSDPRKGQLTDSVLRLKEREPAVEILEGLTVAQHRKSIFDGFLSASSADGKCVCDYCEGSGKLDVSGGWGADDCPPIPEWEDCYECSGSGEVYSSVGKCVSGAGGLTNTLRLKHRAPIVNLPKVGTYYGEEIRGCIVIPDKNHVLCGSDVTSLEDCTKRHFLWDYDSEYVKSMATEGFDPHMALLVVASKITKEDYDFYVQYKSNAR